MRIAFMILLVGVFSTAGMLYAADNPQSAPAAVEQNCTASQCHASLIQGKTVHPATDSCDACHEVVSTPHPQKGKKTFKLTQQPPDLCSNCHDAFAKKVIHPPAKEGECTTCHDPHSSDQPKLLTQPLKDLCATCHSDKLEAKFPHGPAAAGDCTQCHTPHESDAKGLLVKDGPDLCYGCHQDMQQMMQKKNVHPAIDNGCTSCHNPHGSNHPKLLAAEGKEVCFECHSDISDTLKAAEVVHPPIDDEKACANCHSPHASDNDKLLVKSSTKELCLGCHSSVVTKNMTVLHGPVKEGKCTPCHQPHGGGKFLLVKSFPAENYVPYNDKQYELCFSCHNRDLVQYADTSFATNFRDGERNLHYLHVNNKEKGRSCALCHDLHGSAQPKLIADSVPFGKWKLPIKFVKTENGGTCSPGCHAPKTYDRKKG